MAKETNTLKERLFSAVQIALLKINAEFAYRKHRRLYVRYRVRMQQSSETDSQSALADAINNPDASVGVCGSHKVVAVGFNTLCYDASVGVLNPPHE